MKEIIDKVIISSDVGNRDGIGIEVYVDNEVAIEIFRDDSEKRRTMTLFRKDISLETIEESINIFKRDITWEFIVY